LQVTAQERAAIAGYEQRSDQWREARFGRMTASNFGAAAGHHLPGASKKVLTAMLWPEDYKLTGKAAAFAEWGTTMENVAKEMYTAHRKRALGKRLGDLLSVTETGLLVSLECGWLAASPDFVVDEPVVAEESVPVAADVAAAKNPFHAREPYIIEHVVDDAGDKDHTDLTDLTDHTDHTDHVGSSVSAAVVRMVRGCGEIKCPASHVLYSVSGKHDEHQFPKYYYDQIQGTMAINGWPWCDTVVYTPLRTEVIRFFFNDDYWCNTLLPLLKDFYFKTFLPRLLLRVQGRLRQGETDPLVAPLRSCTQAALAAVLNPKRARKKPQAEAESDLCPPASKIKSASGELPQTRIGGLGGKATNARRLQP
jgi:hypothetical protein